MQHEGSLHAVAAVVDVDDDDDYDEAASDSTYGWHAQTTQIGQANLRSIVVVVAVAAVVVGASS